MEHGGKSTNFVQLKYLAAAAAAATPPRPPLGLAGPWPPLGSAGPGRVDPVTDNNNKTNTIIIYKTDVELYKTNTIKRQCKFIPVFSKRFFLYYFITYYKYETVFLRNRHWFSKPTMVFETDDGFPSLSCLISACCVLHDTLIIFLSRISKSNTTIQQYQ